MDNQTTTSTKKRSGPKPKTITVMPSLPPVTALGLLKIPGTNKYAAVTYTIQDDKVTNVEMSEPDNLHHTRVELKIRVQRSLFDTEVE